MAQHQNKPPTTPSSPAVSSIRTRARTLLPFGMTALVSVVLSLLVQSMLCSRQQLPTPSITVTTTTTTQESAPSQTLPISLPSLVSTASPPPPTILPTSLSLRPTPFAPEGPATITKPSDDLRNLWSAYYLMRAANQLTDAEEALRVNNLGEVRQVLVTVGVSLDFAYEQSAEQHKGPIQEFRLQISAIYEEIYNRPEQIDQRLHRMRQSMLSLVEVDH